jgi:hypothetical protein
MSSISSIWKVHCSSYNIYFSPLPNFSYFSSGSRKLLPWLTHPSIHFYLHVLTHPSIHFYIHVHFCSFIYWSTPIKRVPLYSTWGCAGQLYGFEHWEPSPLWDRRNMHVGALWELYLMRLVIFKKVEDIVVIYMFVQPQSFE